MSALMLKPFCMEYSRARLFPRFVDENTEKLAKLADGGLSTLNPQPLPYLIRIFSQTSQADSDPCESVTVFQYLKNNKLRKSEPLVCLTFSFSPLPTAVQSLLIFLTHHEEGNCSQTSLLYLEGRCLASGRSRAWKNRCGRWSPINPVPQGRILYPVCLDFKHHS
jgi:hypothetical protein